MGYMVREYGQVISLEVKARMPSILHKTETKAARMLRIRNLVPQPDFSNPVYTGDKNLHGRVAKHGYKEGQPLTAGTAVPYKLFAYRAQNKPDALRDVLGAWEFGRRGNEKIGTVILTQKYVSKKGSLIDGYGHENESYGELEGPKTLVFRHRKGKVTTRFYKKGPSFWEGPFIPPPGWTAQKGFNHYLRRGR